jgi:hypothetical protein
VPEGGIAAVEIGLRGTTDVFFPLRNDPLAGGAGGGGRSAAPLVLLPPAAAGLLALGVLLYRCRAPARAAAA